jgi:hypothetical protein
MYKIIAASLLATFAIAGLGTPFSMAAEVPCEQMLKDMRAAKSSAKLAAADLAKVNDLEAKAVERCNADDDARSDKFSTEAMAIIRK